MTFYKIAEVVGGTIRLEGDADFRPMSADWRTHCYKGKKHKDPGYLTDDGTPGEWGTLGWMSTPDYEARPDPAEDVELPVDPTPAPTGDSPDSSPPQTETDHTDGAPADPVLWPPANPDESQR